MSSSANGVMYDKQSLINYIKDIDEDIVYKDYLNDILDSIATDQKKVCDLIEITDRIEFYKTNGAVDHTHIFHLNKFDKIVADCIAFDKDGISIFFNDINIIESLGADQLLLLLGYLVELGYNKLEKTYKKKWYYLTRC